MSASEKEPVPAPTKRSPAMHVARWTRGLVLAVVSTVLLWTVVSVLLLSTPQGLRLLSTVAQRATHHALQIGHVEGSVLGGFVADGVSWHGKNGSRIELAALHFGWSPWALARGTVHITQLELDGLRVATAAKPKASTKPHKTAFRLPAGLPLNLRIDDLTVNDARLTAAGGKPFKLIKAQLEGSWYGHTLRIDRFALNSKKTGPVQLRAQAMTGSDALRILALELTGPGTLKLQGRLGYAATPSDLKLELHGLHWPLAGKQADTTLKGLGGTAELSGRLLQGQFKFLAKLHAQARGRHATAQLQGSGTPRQVKLAALSLQVDKNGRVEGHGELTLKPSPAARFDLDIAHFNPKPFAPQWPGDINGRLKIRTTPQAQGGGQQIKLTAKLEHSTLRGQPLQVDTATQADWAKGQWEVDVDHLTAQLGSTQLQIAGRVTPPFALHGKIDSGDLSQLAPQLSGRLKADFKLSGTRKAPVLVSHGQAGQLQLAGAQLAAAKWDVAVDVPGHSRLTVDARDLQFRGSTLNTLQLQGSGTTRHHQLQLKLTSSRGDAAARLVGGYDIKASRWSGKLAALTLSPQKPAGLAPWHLVAPAALTAAFAGSQDHFKLARACLENGAGQLCLHASQSRGQTQLGFKLTAVQLAAFQAVLPAAVKVRGEVSGHGQLHRSPKKLDAKLQLQMAAGRVDVKDAPAVELQPSHVLISNDSEGLNVQMDVHTNRGYVTAKLRSSAFGGDWQRYKQAPLAGKLALSLPDIAFLEPMVAEQVKNLAGKVAGQVSVGGTVGAPQLNGKLVLSGGRASLLVTGTTFTDIGVVVTGRDGAPLEVSGALNSGKGSLKLSGQVDPSQWPAPVDLRVEGKNFQVMNTPDARIAVSPTLNLVRGPDGIDLKGTIFVSHAELTPRGGIIKDKGVNVSPDQVIVGMPAKPKAPEPQVHVQLALVLGKDVSFKGFGLKTRIEGGVVIRQEPSQPALAQGQFYLEDGHYKAYGQNLTIETGHLIFDGGPVTEPAIDIVAVRKPRADIRVGVQVRGTLDRPQLSLTSTPAMSQQEQLSWLLFGHGLNEGPGGDQSQVAAAALALGLGGGGYVANRIGRKLGIDEVSIGSPTGGGSAVATNARTINGSMAAEGYGTSDAGQNAQLTLGKYLTPRLYVSYGVSLFQPGQVFRLLYDLGHGFKLQTESGVSNGGDLLYTFESGH